MQKRFSDREFVAARDARQCSGFVRTVIAGRAIAAGLAGRKPGGSNAVPPIVDTNRARKAGSIIATGNVRTGSVTRRLA